MQLSSNCGVTELPSCAVQEDLRRLPEEFLATICPHGTEAAGQGPAARTRHLPRGVALGHLHRPVREAGPVTPIASSRILPPLSTQTIPSFPLCFRSPLFQVQTAFHVRDHRYRTETANEHALRQQRAVFLNQGEEESHFPKRSMTSVLQPSHGRQTLPRQWPHPETWPILPHL